MSQETQPIFILSGNDYERIEALTERFKMALYAFIESRELEPILSQPLPMEKHFFDTADELIWEAFGDTANNSDLF